MSGLHQYKGELKEYHCLISKYEYNTCLVTKDTFTDLIIKGFTKFDLKITSLPLIF